FEITTPVPLESDELLLRARASYRDAEDRPREATAQVTIRTCSAEEALAERADEEGISRLLVQLPAQAEMATALAFEAGDLAGASAALNASRSAMADMRRRYGGAASMRAEMASWEARLTSLTASTETRQLTGPELKTMYAAGYDMSRSRPRRPPML